MTKNENFKQRIRERMAKTGERYTAARRSLIDQTPSLRHRVWVSDPEFTDDVIRTNTGRGWDEWCDIIDAGPGRSAGHTAIATFIREDLGVDAWWAQAVTVSYERITGLRLPNQRADGTFAADKTKTISFDAERLRAMLLDDEDRADLFGGEETELRSKPTSKSLRIRIGPGVALFAIEAKADGRTKVTVSHERLPEVADVSEWKFYWSEWLTALDEG